MVWKFFNSFFMIIGFNCLKRCIVLRININILNVVCSLLLFKNFISYMGKKFVLKLFILCFVLELCREL